MKIARTIVLSLTVLALGAGHPASAQAPAGVGSRSIQGIGPGGSPGVPPIRISITSGNGLIDWEIANILAQLASRFQVLPRVYFYDDATSPNAVSLPYPLRLGGPNDYPPERDPFGTMLLGINLLNSDLGSTPPGQANYTVTAIMAHELGHTLQYLKKSRLRNPQRELQADFLAGWAIKCLKRTGWPIEEGDIIGSFYKNGDAAFCTPDHGTKEQRLEAFLAGFKVENDDVNVAYAQAETFVRTHIPTRGTAGVAPAGPPAAQPGGAAGPGGARGEVFARNLGICYERIPRPDGTFAVKVTRPPAADSAAARGGLELGDIILSMNAMPFRSEADVLNHVGPTSVSLINVRTGQLVNTVIEIPGAFPGSPDPAPAQDPVVDEEIVPL
jgi:hypothetical protein